MRRSLVCLAAFLLAGCAAPADGPRDPGPAAPAADCTEDCPTAEVDAPDLAVGTFWRYRAQGSFDIEKEFTVVVARADATGYLFAGSSETEIDSVVTWWRPWFGERDRELNPPYPYTETPGPQVLFDFPLFDGKSWVAWPAGPQVTAKADNLTTPSGSMPGFVISGQKDELKVEWDYVPALGSFTKYKSGRASLTHDLELVAYGNGSNWIWYEMGPSTTVFWDGPTSASAQSTLNVADGMDAVVGLAYGKSGARGGLVRPGPGTQPWTFEATDCCTSGDDWINVNLPAETGDWRLFVTAPAPDTWGEIDVAAVKWLRSA